MLDLRVDARAWPLVGRERQLELTRRALKERNSVVVCGTAGVGKTSLMRNVLRRAAAEGNAVEWVAATRSSASMPFGAYAHLLPPMTTGYANRALLLSATIRTVIDRARSRPLLVAVDDAHLLDPGSATLTFMLHSTGAAQVVATARSEVGPRRHLGFVEEAVRRTDRPGAARPGPGARRTHHRPRWAGRTTNRRLVRRPKRRESAADP